MSNKFEPGDVVFCFYNPYTWYRGLFVILDVKPVSINSDRITLFYLGYNSHRHLQTEPEFIRTCASNSVVGNLLVKLSDIKNIHLLKPDDFTDKHDNQFLKNEQKW